MPDISGKRFVLSHTLTPRQRASLAPRITKAGGVVRERLTRRTDFVVVSTGEIRLAEPQQKGGPRLVTVAEVRKMLDQTMLLSREDGVEHMLDLSTGQQFRRFPEALTSMRRLKEREVTQERIEEILAVAGIRTSRDDDGDTLVSAMGETVNILVSPERKFVRFLKLVVVPPGASDDTKCVVVSRLNNEYDVVRFRLWAEEGFCADYSMPFEHGLSPAQLVSMLLGFTWVIRTALQSDIAADLLG